MIKKIIDIDKDILKSKLLNKIERYDNKIIYYFKPNFIHYIKIKNAEKNNIFDIIDKILSKEKLNVINLDISKSNYFFHTSETFFINFKITGLNFFEILYEDKYFGEKKNLIWFNRFCNKSFCFLYLFDINYNNKIRLFNAEFLNPYEDIENHEFYIYKDMDSDIFFNYELYQKYDMNNLIDYNKKEEYDNSIVVRYNYDNLFGENSNKIVDSYIFTKEQLESSNIKLLKIFCIEII